MSIPVDTSSNYMRGQIFRDLNTMKLNFPELFQDENFHGSEAFIFLLSKEEEEDGMLLADLVYFGANNESLFILDGKNYLAKIPYSKVSSFFPQSINKPNYYFPPANTPKRAMLIEIKFKNENYKERILTLIFPDTALMEFELDYPSQDVHLKLMEVNKINKFISDFPSQSLIELTNIIGPNFIPNEINRERCSIDYYLGA